MTITELAPATRGMVAGLLIGFVPTFGIGAATGSIIQGSKDDSTLTFEVNGQLYGHCDKIDTHTWRCTP